MSFTGFPIEAIRFYEGLTADNSKAFWQANKGVYQDSVKGVFNALAEALAAYGPFHLFRPYNDVRFAKGRPLYKDHQGMYGESEGGAGHYVHLSAEGLMIGAGYYAMAADQLERFRRAIDDDHRGASLVAVGDAVVAQGFELGAIDALKTAPRGYPKDHPRIEYLRRKGLIASRQWQVEPWLHTPEVLDRIVESFQQIEPLNAWLDAHVGPSELPPDDRPF